jgi:hypothetical protein
MKNGSIRKQTGRKTVVLKAFAIDQVWDSKVSNVWVGVERKGSSLDILRRKH